MKSKTLISLLVIVLVLVGLTAWSRQDAKPNNNQSAAVLVAAETDFDFGQVRINDGLISHNFTVKNDSAAAITIKKIYTSCMCTTAVWKDKNGTAGPFGMPGHGAIPEVSRTLAPGETATVEVTFDPAAHGPAGIGRVERLVYLENDAAEPFVLKFAANVTP